VLRGVYLIGRSPARRLFRQLLCLFFGFPFRLNPLLKSARQSVKMKYKYLWQLLCVDRDRDWKGNGDGDGDGGLRKSSATPTLKSAWLELSWAELTCPSFVSFRLPYFLLLSCHVSELGLNLSLARLNSTQLLTQRASFPFWLF